MRTPWKNVASQLSVALRGQRTVVKERGRSPHASEAGRVHGPPTLSLALGGSLPSLQARKHTEKQRCLKPGCHPHPQLWGDRSSSGVSRRCEEKAASQAGLTLGQPGPEVQRVLLLPRVVSALGLHHQHEPLLLELCP